MVRKLILYLTLAILTGLLSVTGLTAQENIAYKVLCRETIFSDPPFKQCHASTLAEPERGEIMAAWFGGSYEGAADVCIWSSVKINENWSAPTKLVCGIISDTLRYACWNPVFFSEDEKQLMLYYKVGLNPREWQGMMILSADNGVTWSAPERLEGRVGPSKNKPVITAKGTWLNPSSRETTHDWKVFIERSTDKGKTWVVIPVDTVNTARVIQPALLEYPDGKLQALCRSDRDHILESWSADDGMSWSPFQPTDLPNPNSGIDALTLHSGLQLLVYNPTRHGPDWMNGRNRLSVALSRDGKDWTEIMPLENQAEGEFSYPAVIQSADGVVHITYTYNRNVIIHTAIQFSGESR